MVKKRAPEDGAIVEVKRQKTENAIVVGSGKSNLPQGPKRTSALLAPTVLLTGHQAAVFTVHFNPYGDVLASGSHDKSILCWRTYGECENFLVLNGHKNAVLELHWAPDSESIVSASADHTVRSFDALTGEQLVRWDHKAIVNSCNIAKTGPPLVLSGSDDCTAKIWDPRQQRRKSPVSTLTSKFPITSVAFSDASDQVFTGGVDNVVHVWDLRRQDEAVLTLAGHSDTITGIKVSPTGTHLLTNSMDNTVRSWDIRPYAPENRCVGVFTGHQHGFEKNLLRCDWSPDGSLISAGSADSIVYVWDAKSAEIKYKLGGHKGSVNEVVFHPKEPIIASASSDKTIYLGELAEYL